MNNHRIETISVNFMFCSIFYYWFLYFSLIQKYRWLVTTTSPLVVPMATQTPKARYTAPDVTLALFSSVPYSVANPKSVVHTVPPAAPSTAKPLLPACNCESGKILNPLQPGGIFFCHILEPYLIYHYILLEY